MGFSNHNQRSRRSLGPGMRRAMAGWFMEALEPRQLLSAGTPTDVLPGAGVSVALSATTSYGTVNGTVTDAGGNPLVGAMVTILTTNTATVAQGATDANGNYSFNVAAGTYLAGASLAGYQTGYSAYFVVGSGAVTAPALQLAALSTVTGLVTDAGGAALAGVSINMVQSGSSTSFTGTTDSTGHYTFSVAQGNYVVRAGKTGYQAVYSATFAVGAGAVAAPTLQLTALSAVTGLVTDGGGAALAGVSMSIVQSGNSTAAATGTTDSSGHYTFSVLPGNYVVRASKTGYQGAYSATFAVSGSAVTAPTLQLAVQVTGTITGLVTDTGGSPLSGVALSLMLYSGGTSSAITGTTDSYGHYTFTATPGNYVLRASKDGYQVVYSATFAVVQGANTGPTLQLASTAVNTHTPMGFVDVCTRQTVSGWAFDADAGAASIQVRVDIDGVAGTPFAASVARDDLAGFGPVGSPNHGFSFTMPTTLSNYAHSVVVYVQNYPGTSFVALSSPMTIPAVVNHAPMGFVESANRQSVSGWAFDQDAGATSVQVRVDIDGVAGTPFTAGAARADLAAYAPIGSANHGFSFAMPTLSDYAHNVMVYVQNYPGTEFVAVSSPLTIPAIVNHVPTGWVESVSRQSVSGWAFDQDAGAASVQVRVDIDGVAGTPFTASVARDDLAAFAPIGSPNHGFTYTMPTLSNAAHSVMVYVQDYPGTRFVAVSSPMTIAAVVNHAPLGFVETANRQSVSGWAFDQDAGATSIQVRVDIDGVAGTPFLANAARTDLAAYAPIGSPNHGFTFTMPTLGSGSHIVAVYAQDVGGTGFVQLARLTV